MRQVPDNQEVYVQKDSDSSIIVEAVVPDENGIGYYNAFKTIASNHKFLLGFTGSS